MKKIVFAVLLFSNFCLASPNWWVEDLTVAQNIAVQENKLIFCVFEDYQTSRYWNAFFLNHIPRNTDLQDEFVFLRLDFSMHDDLFRKYNGTLRPYILILDGGGKLIHREWNRWNSNSLGFLKKNYSINTEFVQQELLSYLRAKNYVTSLQLGKKYMDFAIAHEGRFQFQLLQLANAYFDEAKNYLTEVDAKNADRLKRLVALNQAEYLLLSRKRAKAKKTLEALATEQEHFEAQNQEHFNYLHALALHQGIAVAANVDNTELNDYYKRKLFLINPADKTKYISNE